MLLAAARSIPDALRAEDASAREGLIPEAIRSARET
jgi:hypothetical protein